MDIRPIDESELEAWLSCLIRTFGGDPEGDPDASERHLALIDLTRTFAAFDGKQVVGTAAGFDFALAVPGGRVAMSGLTMVSVTPTHRRRGILRALIGEHLAAARRHGDPLSGLWASEATIYGRFGYGIAAEGEQLTFDATRARLIDPHPRDEVALASDDHALAAMSQVYEAASTQRPGLFARTMPWWRLRILKERPHQKTGASQRRFAIATRRGAPVGYAVFRQRLAFDAGIPVGTIDIDELCAVDAPAEATLWAFLGAIDLYPKVSWRLAPVDTILPWILHDPRRVQRARVETLWLRIDDVARVLSARRYALDGVLGLEVDGEPYTLTSEGGVARCEPGAAKIDLRCDRQGLASLYLGAFSATNLARAGRLSGDASAILRADLLFSSALAPWCAEIF
jgi:predicted acetyltransferase